ncbi:MAG: glycosyltransferase [Tannerella sp.]|jgi:glycosyltransferase involved in cell wall biosynthesis|nr:glycosyltransferase [Tannerella sp.]
MKRILLVNKFYYPRGGDCTAVLTTEQLLKAKGHNVAIFSMQHADNIVSPWETYFPEEISFSQPGVSGKMKAARRIFHSSAVVSQFTRILNDFKPDVVHLHNIHSYLSPVVAQIAHQKGIPVVWTLHDYKLICPVYTCLHAGKPCELCFSDKSHVFRRRCMKNSRTASMLAWMEALYWNRRKLERIISRFISPSLFLKEKMTSAGFHPDQIEALPNFMYKHSPRITEKEDYYCYVGRLSSEKGVDTLLEAARKIPYPLKIIGDGYLSDRFKKQYPHTHIEFLGQLPSERLLPIVQKARFLVMPSVWYENNPFSVIEALCMGTPTLGARIGGIPELIDTKTNGDLFSPGNAEELASKITACIRRFSDTYDFEKIAETAQNKFSSGTFYNKLIQIYGH